MKAQLNTCPECGTNKVAEITYGYPSKELLKEVEQNHENPSIFLGGCCVSPEMPKWHCNLCNHEWGKISS